MRHNIESIKILILGNKLTKKVVVGFFAQQKRKKSERPSERAGHAGLTFFQAASARAGWQSTKPITM